MGSSKKTKKTKTPNADKDTPNQTNGVTMASASATVRHGADAIPSTYPEPTLQSQPTPSPPQPVPRNLTQHFAATSISPQTIPTPRPVDDGQRSTDDSLLVGMALGEPHDGPMDNDDLQDEINDMHEDLKRKRRAKQDACDPRKKQKTRGDSSGNDASNGGGGQGPTSGSGDAANMAGEKGKGGN